MQAIEIKTLKLEKHGFWSIHKGQYSMWYRLVDPCGLIKWDTVSFYSPDPEKGPKTIRCFGVYGGKRYQGRLNLKTLRITHLKSDEHDVTDKSWAIFKDDQLFKVVSGNELCFAWVRALRRQSDAHISFQEVK